MNLLELLTYDAIFFDNRICIKGALSDKEGYYLIKNKLIKSTLYVINIITFYWLDATSAYINVNIKKEDFFNVFDFIPSKVCLDYGFPKFMPSTIYLEDVENIISNINSGKFNISTFQGIIEEAFSNPASIQKIESYPNLGKELKSALELYITFKVFEAISKI